jgi:small subunit ribosomal protein S4
MDHPRERQTAYRFDRGPSFALETGHFAGPMGPRGVSRPVVWAGASAANLSVPGSSLDRGGRDPQHARYSFGESAGIGTNSEDAMTKRHQAKYKIDRRMGQNIWGRPKSPINKREYGPGQHGQRRKGKLSDYGVQLRAKQKLKGYYANMSERHFRGIYEEARRLKGDTGAHMIGLLERRLDTVIYRAKFVPTVFAARQFISHGHIKVNGKRVTIASFRVKVGDVIEVKDKSKQLALVVEANALAERDVPDYIEVDHTKMTAKFSRIPVLGEVPYPVMMEPHLVVEYYSR